jgi:hypothetical protein
LGRGEVVSDVLDVLARSLASSIDGQSGQSDAEQEERRRFRDGLGRIGRVVQRGIGR